MNEETGLAAAAERQDPGEAEGRRWREESRRQTAATALWTTKQEEEKGIFEDGVAEKNRRHSSDISRQPKRLE